MSFLGNREREDKENTKKAKGTLAAMLFCLFLFCFDAVLKSKSVLLSQCWCCIACGYVHVIPQWKKKKERCGDGEKRKRKKGKEKKRSKFFVGSLAFS